MMKSSLSFRSKLVLGALLPVLWVGSFNTASARPPRSAGVVVTRAGPAGNTSVRRTNVTTNGAGGFSSASTYTGPAGRVTTQQQSGAYNPATQTFSRSGTTTFPNGTSATFSASTKATGNGGYTHSGQWTGPNGRTVTTSGQGSYNPATGTYTQSRTTTGPNGHSAVESRTVTVNPN